MPFVLVRQDIIDKLVDLRQDLLKKEDCVGTQHEHAMGKEEGFIQTLRMCFDSEDLAWWIFERECIINGTGSLFNELPRLVTA